MKKMITYFQYIFYVTQFSSKKTIFNNLYIYEY